MGKGIIVLYLGRTGAGPVYTYEMVVALLKKEEKIVVILSEYIANKTAWDSLSNCNLQIQYVKTFRNFKEFIINTLLFRYIRIIKYINALNFDVLYSPMGHIWDILIFKFAKIKVKIKTIHDVILHVGEDSLLNRFLHLFSFKNADKFIILSNNYIELLEKKGIERKNIIIIPHANFTFYNNLSRRIEANNEIAKDGIRRIVFFGRIEKYKGIEVLLQAFDKVLKSNKDVELSIVGSGDLSPYSHLMGKVNNNLVIYNQWVEDADVSYFIQKSEFVVLQYIQASQSGVIPLAQNFGKPVVASAVGGIPEQISHMQTGILIPAAQIDILANTILMLLNDKDLLNHMAESCIKNNQEQSYSWDTSADIFINSINL